MNNGSGIIDSMESTDLLVLILSGTLIVLLVLLIVIAGYVITILKKLNSISTKAEAIANRAEHVGEFFEKAVGPAAILKLATNAVEVVLKSRNKRRS